MEKIGIFVIGSGGHSKVVTEMIATSQIWDVAAYVDDSKENDTFLEKKVFKNLRDAMALHPSIKNAFVAIGDNHNRKRWNQFLQLNGFKIPTLIHPSAYISPSATIGDGVVICAKSIVGAAARVADGVILNCSAILDHDARIGSFSHLSQGAIACGGSQIGDNTLIGPGCVIEELAQVDSDVSTKLLHSIAPIK